MKPIVYLVGAGPGDPGLLTLRGRECLEQADFVLYDQLVSEQILNFAPPHAVRMCVRDLAGTHPDRWPHIHLKLIAEARQGKCVVRLKGGDPLIFGRGGEEADALREAGIPFEIVPGVTAALAAGAALEIPLTDRRHASAVAFITGHEHPGKPSSRLDWSALARFPGTLVIYMGFSRLGMIVPELIRCGKPANTPAAAVSHASTGEQRSVTCSLAELETSVRAAGLTTPALILIGPVVGLRPPISWFEARPLFGMRAIITRPLKQALPMKHQLELLGAVAHLLPTVEIQPPNDWAEVDAALSRMAAGEFNWLVFTSANGVEMFMKRLRDSGRDLRLLGSVKLAAIGPSTAASLRALHLEPDLTPAAQSRSETLARLLKDRVRGQRVLLAQAEQAREHLQTELADVASIEKIAVYRQSEAVDPKSPAFDGLRRGEIDCVPLTSPAIARGFLTAVDSLIADRIRGHQVRLVTNGPRISAAVKEFGFPVAAESAEPTLESLIGVLIEMWREQKAETNSPRPDD